jgi:uncharacterized membrane protein SirB2
MPPVSATLDLLRSHVPEIKLAHLGLVGCSGALFAARGFGVRAGRAWPMRRWSRRLSVGVDTGLLAAGVAMWAALGLDPVRDAWLGTKLVLLLAYIGVGSLALKRGRTAGVRTAALLVALVLYAQIVGVALAHDPMGWLARWGRA